MQHRIITRYTSNGAGASRIVGRYNGHQKSRPYDSELSPGANHRTVAMMLAGEHSVKLVDHHDGKAIWDIKSETVTSTRSGEVFKLIEDKGTSLILDDGQTVFEARAKGFVPGGDFTPKTAAPWNGGPAVTL